MNKPTTIETTTSTLEPVSLEALITHCNAVATSDDDLIRDLRRVAREMVEADTHLSLIPKTIRHRIPHWPLANQPIELPAGPITSVTKIEYRDIDGVVTEWASEGNWTLDSDRRPGAIWLAPNADWPDTDLDYVDAITITYAAGYDPTTNPAPAMAIHAIKLLVGHWYKNRETVLTGVVSKEIEVGYERLINLLKEFTYP